MIIQRRQFFAALGLGSAGAALAARKPDRFMVSNDTIELPAGTLFVIPHRATYLNCIFELAAGVTLQIYGTVRACIFSGEDTAQINFEQGSVVDHCSYRARRPAVVPPVSEVGCLCCQRGPRVSVSALASVLF